MKKLFFILIAAICFFSCSSKKTTDATAQSNAGDSTNTDTATASFFPVTSFIKGQMLQFDSLLITPMRILTIQGKADSQWLKREQLKPLLQAFTTPEINETNLIKFFKESKFNDQTINAVTLSYEPITNLPDSINLATWNVYVNPKTGNVTKVYIVKNIVDNNRHITQQLTWQTGKFAEITEILNTPNGKSSLLNQQKIIWDFDN